MERFRKKKKKSKGQGAIGHITVWQTRMSQKKALSEWWDSRATRITLLFI